MQVNKVLMVGRSKELSQDLHSKIVALHNTPKCPPLGGPLLNVITTGAIIHKWKKHHSTINQPHTWAPRKISEQGVKRIVRSVAQEPRNTQKEFQINLQQIQLSQRKQQAMHSTSMASMHTHPRRFHYCKKGMLKLVEVCHTSFGNGCELLANGNFWGRVRSQWSEE